MSSRSPARPARPDPGPFADLLLHHRLAAGLSQRALAEGCGLSERAIRDLERGATIRPRQRSVQAMAAALGLRSDDLTRFLATARAVHGPDRGAPAPLLLSNVDDLVGRERELRQLADLIIGGRHRMVTVTGAGGVGKSRLAAELVSALRHRIGWDIRTLDLSGLADAEPVAEAIAQTLDAGGSSRLPPVERAAAALRSAGRVLLVLDRFEHVMPAAPVVGTIVRRCPGLSVLVTSQRRLGIGGERRFPLDPLPVAAAVELFTRRAAAVGPGFPPTEENTTAVTAICRAVEGLPLALELAAARTRLMTPVELAARLHRQLRLLTDGAADLPARQRSLRASIESSLEVITDDGRILFAWLGAFAGGGWLADLEAVAVSLGRDSVWLLAALGELVDTSLVRVRQLNGASRYLMPDAMTELSREQLAERPDRDAVERSLATRFLGRPADYDRADADNVRTAAQYAIAHAVTLFDPDTVRALYTYYKITGRPLEGQRLLLAAAAAGAPLAYLYAAKFARFLGELPEAARLAQHATSLLDPDDAGGRAEAHLTLGTVAAEAGDNGRARSHFRAVLASARRCRDVALIGRALNSLGVISAATGRLEAAERLFSAGLEARQRSGAGELDVASSHYNLAAVAWELGHHEQALARARHAARKVPERLTAQIATISALALLGLGRKAEAREAVHRIERWLAGTHEEHRQVALIRMRCSVILAATGETAGAAEHLRAALPAMFNGTKRYHEETATLLEAHAGLLAERDPSTAARFLGAADTLRGGSRRLVSAAMASTVDTATQKCRKALGDGRFHQEHRAGRRLSVPSLTEGIRQSASAWEGECVTPPEPVRRGHPARRRSDP